MLVSYVQEFVFVCGGAIQLKSLKGTATSELFPAKGIQHLSYLFSHTHCAQLSTLKRDHRETEETSAPVVRFPNFLVSTEDKRFLFHVALLYIATANRQAISNGSTELD